MELLLETFNENVNKQVLFSEILDVDFYDGPTEALCRLMNSNQWVICSLVYFKPENNDRVFTVLELNNEWFSDLKSTWELQPNDGQAFYKKVKEKISAIYKAYSGKVFLFRGDWLAGEKYEVVQISLKFLKYFNSVEDVLEQPEESKLQWLSFFSGK